MSGQRKIKLSPIELYALGRVDGLGSRSLENLIDSGMTFRQIIESPSEVLKRFIKGARVTQAIETIHRQGVRLVDKAEELIAGLQDSGIRFLSYWDEAYPSLLRDIPDAPFWIYARGNLGLLNDFVCVAIIGTRRSTVQGESIAFKIAADICKSGSTVVSGLAKGIDKAAHEGALSVDGNTIAVLVDVQNIFPPEHIHIAERILEDNGLLISENPPGTRAASGLLVRRDRLQSALSHVVIPVESTLTGGTMHTVRYAQEQQRQVFQLEMAEFMEYQIDQEAFSGIRELETSEYIKQAGPDSLISMISEAAAEYRSDKYKSDNAKTKSHQQDLFGIG